MAFLILFIIMIAISILVGLKRGTVKSLFSIISNFLIIIISFIIARICVIKINDKSVKNMLEYANSRFDLNIEEIIGTKAVQNMTQFILSIIVSLAVFYVCCFALFIIFQILKRIIFRITMNKKYKEFKDAGEKNYKIGGILISVLSAIVSFVIITMPCAVVLNAANESIKEAGYKVPGEVGFVLNNPTYGIVKIFQGERIFDKLTSTSDNKDMKTSNEIKYASTCAIVFANLSDDDSNINANKATRVIRKSLNKSELLPNFIAELGAEAGNNWKNGKSFMKAEIEIPEGREGELANDFLDIIASWNKKSVVEDIETILDVYAIFEKYNVTDLDDTDEFLEAFSGEAFAGDLCVCLFKNEDFSKLVQPVIEYGLGSAFDMIGFELEEGFTSNVDISKMTEEEVRNEVKIASKVINTILDVVNSTEDYENLSEEAAMELTKSLEDLKGSVLLGEISDDIMEQVMHNVK